jgi:alkanesulfonate monooxygenase SsuD/methylene tetrahydromethanopterin reductase-like flavin-dependent oxidoreductase (luciferase family)
MTGTDRSHFLEWMHRVDSGPFATISTGERVLWPQVEAHAFLAAAAAVTERVTVMSHILIAPMHAPVLLAKRLASIDVISGGRLVVGLGVGGRTDDYQAAGSTFEQRWQRLDDCVASMRRVWAGEAPFGDTTATVGPMPVQPGGPKLFTTAEGPKALARAAVWADGWLGAMLMHGLDTRKAEVESHLDAWQRAGRSQRPHLTTSCWFALGDHAKERLQEAAAHYLSAGGSNLDLPFELPFHNEAALETAINECKEAGFDEVIFIPLTDDLGELDRLEAVLGQR